MNKYEIMFIVKSTIEEAEVTKSSDALKEVITNHKGEIIEFKSFGQKQLAYPMKKEVSGNYFLLVCSASPEAITEFERIAKIDENMIRHLIINLDEE